jgi:hypothetical protein
LKKKNQLLHVDKKSKKAEFQFSNRKKKPNIFQNFWEHSGNIIKEGCFFQFSPPGFYPGGQI